MAYKWEVLEELFQTGLTLDKEARVSYIRDKAGNDLALEKTLFDMFAHADEADNYFDRLQEDIALGFTDKPELFQQGDVIGKYRVISTIGKGGMGEVYLAERNDNSYDQEVAIKCFSQKLDSEKFLKNFKQEQQFLANLNHPNIAHIIDGGLTDNQVPYIIMEYVDGPTITEYLSNSALNEKKLLDLFQQVAKTIQFAHNQLVLHLDIKPSNMLVNKNGLVKLLDFGIAKEASADAEDATLNTAASPRFAAPEQLNGGQLSTGTDIYQLGLLLHLLFTKQLPFTEADIQNVNKSRIVEVDANLPTELTAIIKKCLSQDVSDRYTTADQLIADIENYKNGYPVTAYAQEWNYKAEKYIKRNWLAASLMTLVFISLIGGTIISMRQAKIAEQEKEKAERTAAFIEDFFVSSNPLSDEDNSKLTLFEFLDSKTEILKNDESLSKEAKWKLLDILYNIYSDLTETDKSLAIIEEMEKLNSTTNNRQRAIILNIKKGLAYALNYNFNQSDSFLLLALNEYEFLEKENKTDAASLMSQIGLNLHLQGAYDSAELYYKKATYLLNNNQHADVTNKLVSVYTYLSQMKRSIGQFDSAFYYSSKAITIQKDKYGEYSPELINTLADRALINMEVGNYKKSEVDFQKAFEIGYKRVDSTNQNMLIILGNYIILQEYKGDFANAIKLGADYLKLSEDKFALNDINVAYAKLQLASSYLGNNDLENARKHYEEGYEILNEVQSRNMFMEGIFLMQMSRLEILEQQYDHALEFAEAAFNIMNKMLPPDHYRIGLINIRRGKSMIETGKIEEGKNLIEQAIPIIKNSGARRDIYLQEASTYL